MTILAFLVLAGLGLAVTWSFMKRNRDRDRWPNNLINSSNTPSRTDSSADTSWSPSSDALIVAGAVTLTDLASNPTHQSTESNDQTEAGESSWSEHGATGSWAGSESSDTSSNESDSGGSDSGGDSGGDSSD